MNETALVIYTIARFLVFMTGIVGLAAFIHFKLINK
jgi:hypothetical protein